MRFDNLVRDIPGLRFLDSWICLSAVVNQCHILISRLPVIQIKEQVQAVSQCIVNPERADISPIAQVAGPDADGKAISQVNRRSLMQDVPVHDAQELVLGHFRGAVQLVNTQEPGFHALRELIDLIAGGSFTELLQIDLLEQFVSLQIRPPVDNQPPFPVSGAHVKQKLRFASAFLSRNKNIIPDNLCSINRVGYRKRSIAHHPYLPAVYEMREAQIINSKARHCSTSLIMVILTSATVPGFKSFSSSLGMVITAWLPCFAIRLVIV